MICTVTVLVVELPTVSERVDDDELSSLDAPPEISPAACALTGISTARAVPARRTDAFMKSFFKFMISSFFVDFFIIPVFTSNATFS